jgi:hypothetical protein
MITGADLLDALVLYKKNITVKKFKDEVAMKLLHKEETNESIAVTDAAASSVSCAFVNSGSDLLAVK